MECLQKGIEPRLNTDGTNNPKYVDVLEEDKPIAGQKFACVSFISPEKILHDKHMYFFDEFLKQWELSKSLEKFTQFINFLSYKYNFNFDDASKELENFIKTEKEELLKSSMHDEYKTYIDNHEERLQKQFDETHEFQTSTRGVKIRGCFPTQGEAEIRAKLLRELDPNHDVFVGPVGLWMPFDPEAYKTGRVQYLEEQLNQLMHEKNKNEMHSKNNFDLRVKEAKLKAIEENKEKALASGNKLSQTVDADGNLISVKDATSLGYTNEEVVTTDDIKKTLFENDNVVTSNTDHGLSQLSMNKEE